MSEEISYRTERLDHLGIVSGICQEIGLIEAVDEKVGETGRQVSVGQAVQAMVLNGLGFTSRALYLTPEFFRNKPVEVLIGEGITAEMLNDDCLGDALDRLYEAGVTETFAQVAARGCATYGIETKGYHLDSSSFHLHGEYEGEGEQAIEVTHGYSRDHRPELKQVVLNLITTHQGGIPLWLEGLSGNSADKTTFPTSVQAYYEQIKDEGEGYFVADSALYSAANLQQLSTVRWVTRVPLQLTLTKELLVESDEDAVYPLAEGYWGREYEQDYGGVKQRWLVVFSQTAYEREAKTFARQLARAHTAAAATLEKLSRQIFSCRPDAQQALEKATAKWRYHQPSTSIEPIMGYDAPGRPATGAQPTVQGYRITGSVMTNDSLLHILEQRRGKFIISTNQLDRSQLSTRQLLDLYKAQAVTVERGFRFLKDPLFFADSLFLKKPSRLMALLMVMGLSLLIYSLAEQQLRLALHQHDQTIPDQLGKPTQRPTMRRVFQMFEGIDLLLISMAGLIIKRQVLNLRPVHEQILSLLGPSVKNIYIPPD